MESKKCTKCKEEKSLDKFYKRKKSKDGLMEQCISCKKEYDKNYCYQRYHNDIEFNKKQKEVSIKWKKLNPEKTAILDKKHKSSEKHKITRRIYRKKEYDLKYGIDIIWTLKLILRNRLKNAIKNNFKYGKTIELLGCSIEEFKIYLQEKFTPEMNWGNYGKDKYWEIDHIIPCDNFNLLLEEEQQKCFHYTNLQPLEITKNRQKNNKL